MNRTVRFVVYGVITIICILAIFAGVYVLVFKNQTIGNLTNDLNQTNTSTEDPIVQTKNSFMDLFKNYFVASNYKATNIEKLKDDKDLVYEGITLRERKDNVYDLDLHIPVINIKSDLATTYNNTTQSIFVDRANKIIEAVNPKDYTVYSVSFTSYINNDILSLAIMANLKEGDKPQRLMIQTYNYNLLTGKEVNIDDIIKARGLDTNVINKKIAEEVKKANDDALGVTASGYEIYTRDLTSDMYQVQNVSIFMQGPNGELYIIYPYGNIKNTSAIDVIQI